MRTRVSPSPAPCGQVSSWTALRPREDSSDGRRSTDRSRNCSIISVGLLVEIGWFIGIVEPPVVHKADLESEGGVLGVASDDLGGLLGEQPPVWSRPCGPGRVRCFAVCDTGDGTLQPGRSGCGLERRSVESRPDEAFRAGAEHIGLLLPLGVLCGPRPGPWTLADTAAALVLVAVIAAVAILGSRIAGYLASVSAGVWFDFFLTRPYERFAISQRADSQTTISLFVVGLIVTELAARARHHRLAAGEEADYVNLIYEIGEMVAFGELAGTVIGRASDELRELLDLRSCRFESGQLPPHRPTVLWDGRVVHAGAVWGITTLGLPGPEVDLPVDFGGRTVGRFIFVPTPGMPVKPERMIVAVAIAVHVGASLASRARIA